MDEIQRSDFAQKSAHSQFLKNGEVFNEQGPTDEGTIRDTTV
jgi:hypothetical protein